MFFGSELHGNEKIVVYRQQEMPQQTHKELNFSNMYHPEEMIRISARNFGVDENGLTPVPLYAVFCI